MEQWTDSIAVWTTRSTDEWLGDGGFTAAAPISVGFQVSDHFASTLTNTYQAEQPRVKTSLKTATVVVDSEITVEHLTFGVSLPEHQIIIDTACHVSTLALKTTLNAHEGQRVVIAYQTVKPHVQFTPKNPIAESDVLLNPDTLAIGAEVQGPVYAGYYTEVNPDVLRATTYMYPGEARNDTTIELEPSLGISFSTLENVTISRSSMVDAGAVPLHAKLGAAEPEVTCTAEVDTVSIQIDFPGFEFVATGYAMQDDLTLVATVNAATVWNDDIAEHAHLSIASEMRAASVETDSVVDAGTVGIEATVGGHAAGVSEDYAMPTPLGAATSMNATQVYFDYVVVAPSGALSVQSHPITLTLSPVHEAESLTIQAAMPAHDYAGLRLTEYAMLESGVTREIVLTTPVNAYSEAAEVI
jgi:hypothetical protein